MPSIDQSDRFRKLHTAMLCDLIGRHESHDQGLLYHGASCVENHEKSWKIVENITWRGKTRKINEQR